MEPLIAATMTTESPTWRRVTQLADLAEVYDPTVQVCALPCEMDPDVSQYLAGLESTAMIQAIETLSAAGRPRLTALPAGPGRDALIDDLSAYEMPERLPNGDIIIRRIPEASPPVQDAPEVGEGGDVEL